MQEEYEIDLLDLIIFLLRRIKMIGIVTVLSAGLGLILVSFVLRPVYEASTRVYILGRQAEDILSYDDYQMSDQIVSDYKVLVTGQNVMEEVIRILELDLKAEALEKMIRIDAPENTRVLQITVADFEPQRAADIANAVRETAGRQMQSIMDAQTVHLIHEAESPEEPAGPCKQKVTLSAAGLGFVSVIIILSAMYIRDDAIRTEEDVEQRLGLDVLGTVPESAEMCAFAIVSTEQRGCQTGA